MTLKCSLFQQVNFLKISHASRLDCEYDYQYLYKYFISRNIAAYKVYQIKFEYTRLLIDLLAILKKSLSRTLLRYILWNFFEYVQNR